MPIGAFNKYKRSEETLAMNDYQGKPFRTSKVIHSLCCSEHIPGLYPYSVKKSVRTASYLDHIWTSPMHNLPIPASVSSAVQPKSIVTRKNKRRCSRYFRVSTFKATSSFGERPRSCSHALGESISFPGPVHPVSSIRAPIWRLFSLR